MKRTFLFVYILMVAVLAIATFLEQARGTDFAARIVYHSIWFFTLWTVLGVGLIAVIVKKKLWQRAALCLLHVSFLVILLGAGVTFFTSQKGFVHLDEGQTVHTFFEEGHPTNAHAFPFSLRLDSFRIVRYPGTEAAADYASYLKIKPVDGGKEESVKVSMNHICSHGGYRLYQSSYDENGSGSYLSVNYDPYGTGITYTGYALLALSMIGVLFARKEEFRRLLRHPLLKRGGMVCLLLLCSVNVRAERHSLPAFNRAKADSLALRQVVYNDRVCPFNTLARDFMLKLCGQTTYGGLTAEQVVSGWLLRPDAWQHEPMILIKNRELRSLLGIEGKRARLTDLFEGDEYKLNRYWQGGDLASAKGSLQKAIAETDEKVGLLLMLQQGRLIVPRPYNVTPLSPMKVKAEILYNQLDLAKWLFMACLGLGMLLFLRMAGQRRSARQPRASALPRFLESKYIDKGAEAALWTVAAVMLLNYLLRWYVAGRVPMSNGYETMLFMSLCCIVAATALYRRFEVMLPFGFLLSGFTLLVAHLGQSNPQITPLVPVLVSPWLSVHVSMMMMAYSLLAFICLNGIAAFINKAEGERLMLLSRLLLYPAVFMLAVGIFLGAVWANQSWGSYWTWDPKEVWALITLMIYAVLFHSDSIATLRRPRSFHVFAVAAFLAVLMTYFGVNFFLGGMHSYAN